tara:strand:+ start:58 stop:165 length:108 start_codon:yes stop_codon:yes gene_type:complete
MVVVVVLRQGKLVLMENPQYFQQLSLLVVVAADLK